MDNDKNIKDIDILGFMYSDHWKQNAKTIAEIASPFLSMQLSIIIIVLLAHVNRNQITHLKKCETPPSLLNYS